MPLRSLTLSWLIIGPTCAQQDGGKWEGPYEMPVLAAAAANLADGTILAWAAYNPYNYGGPGGRTSYSIFDPATPDVLSSWDITDTNHDMFCPGTAVLSDGRIMISGGQNADAVTFYDPAADDSWYAGERLNIPRGYHSMTVLGDGSVFTLGGSWGRVVRGNKHGELWTPGEGWQLKNNIVLSDGSSFLTEDREGVYRSDNHMWLFEAPNGYLFHAGPSKQMHWIDSAGDGQIMDSLLRGDDNHAMNGNAIMFDIGKILVVGGAPNYNLAEGSASAYVIDIKHPKSMGKEKVTRVGDMSFQRTVANSVVLPSGEVVVVGGQSYVRIFSDDNAILNAELWSPITGNFTTMAAMSVPRAYHSVAILMKDGRVWAAGGGLCGNCAANHPDAEIFTPPYLLDADGSPKTRPIITSAPTEVRPGDNVVITMNTKGRHTFALVRLSAVTHSLNNDLRRIPLKVKGQNKGPNRDSLLVKVPRSYSVVIPGTYFLFAMNADGVPSVAKTVTVKSPRGNAQLGQKSGSIGRINPTQTDLSISSECLAGQCVGIFKGNANDNARVVHWPCHGGRNQRFQFEAVRKGVYRVKSKHSSKCLTVKDASTAELARVIQLSCKDQPHQLWTIAGTGSNQRLKAAHTKMCLTITGTPSDPGMDLVQATCSNKMNEIWRISDSLVTSGPLSAPPTDILFPVQTQIASLEFSGLCVEIADGSQIDGASAIQWPCDEEEHQLFVFQSVDDGFYRIVAQHSSKCLTVENGSTAPGAFVVQDTCRDEAHQLWKIVGDGGTQQLKLKHSGKCLNNLMGTSDQGYDLIQWDCRGGESEFWSISDGL